MIFKKKKLPESIIKNIENIGPVLFEFSKKARKPNISIRPFKGVRVAIPRGFKIEVGEKFLNEKLGWVTKKLKLINELEVAIGNNKQIIIPVEESRKILTERITVLAQEHGFAYGKISVKKMKTRWGSCSARNNISLNSYLMNIPNDLIDYVILHELVHTNIKNHGQEFWKELDTYLNGSSARELQKRLKKYGFNLD